MSYQKPNKSTSNRTSRVAANDTEYMAEIENHVEWYTERNIVITAFYREPFPATKGVRWTAVVNVGGSHPKVKPGGLALKLVSLMFVGAYDTRLWDTRSKSGDIFEVSWFTNEMD